MSYQTKVMAEDWMQCPTLLVFFLSLPTFSPVQRHLLGARTLFSVKAAEDDPQKAFSGHCLVANLDSKMEALTVTP